MMDRHGWWHTPLLIVLAAAVVIGLIYVDRNARAAKAERDEILERAAPLELERDELITRRQRGQSQLEDERFSPATEQLLFLELDPRLMSEALPAMLSREIPGVLGLYEGNYPGDPGRISREDFDRLLAAGWGLCLVYDGGDDFAAWDAAVGQRLAALGVSKPGVIYFQEGDYRADREEALIAAGYTVAVHHGENFLPLIAEDSDGALWLPGAHPWNYSGVRDQIRSVVEKGGEHCYTIRFSEGREIFEPGAFENMLNFIQPFREAGELQVTGFPLARELHDPLRNGAAAAREAWEQENAEIEGRIRALDEEIQAIYAEWNGDNDD